MWLMTGFHSEKFRDNLAKNVNMFLESDPNVKILIVLQNNLMFEKQDRVTTIESETGVIPYLQAGLNFLRNNSNEGEWFARFDSDDWYSPKYLEAIMKVQETDAVWSCIPSPYVKVGDTLVWCEKFPQENISGLGGTLASKINCAVDFTAPNLDDVTWCNDMHAKGHKAIARGPEGFALLRHEGHKHVFPMPAESLIHAWPCDAYSQGTLNIDSPPHTNNLIQNNPEIAMTGVKILNKSR